MASAQVLPNSATASRKQEHLEAGKRRLEEFRKKKAADRAKKAVSSSQINSVDVGTNEKQSAESQHVRTAESDGAGTSDGFGKAAIEHSLVNNDGNANETIQNSSLDSSYGAHATAHLSTRLANSFSTETLKMDQDFDRHSTSGSDGPLNFTYIPQSRENNGNLGIDRGTSGRVTYGTTTDQFIAPRPEAVRAIDSNSSQTSHNGSEDTQSKDNYSSVNDFTVKNHGASRLHPENSGNTVLQNRFGYTNPLASSLSSSSYEDSIYSTNNITDSSPETGHSIRGALQFNSTSDTSERKLSIFGDPFPTNSASKSASESRSTDFTFDNTNPTNYVPSYPAVSETNTRRSRPSFLDSINVPRVSSISNPTTEPQKAETFSSKVLNMDELASSALENSHAENGRVEPFLKLSASGISGSFEHSFPSSVSAGNGSDLYTHRVGENTLERKDDFHFRKQDEDFSALEQHIEDLTQEKFSLQRALEASRALAESLATENSSLTDSYNQQGSVVNQLKAEMENLQEEIKSELGLLESLKIEYANAQLECNAADERSRLLASEVIGLEEKALQLRSSELKLERQLENSQAEIAGFRKKMSSLEKERQDLQSTIDALQEEKKLLQAKLRKASATGKQIDISKSPADKKDVSTSTEDLVHGVDTDTTDATIPEMHSSAPLVSSEASSFSWSSENRQLNPEVSSFNIPSDQIRMIQNINILISELALEKEELVQALLAESSQSFQLKELNKELVRKLEAQTQRLELLTAQSMANEIVPARQTDSRTIPDSTPYADEGDEVVERVLGWIMKLFPGGPSRRRTSKLL